MNTEVIAVHDPIMFGATARPIYYSPDAQSDLESEMSPMSTFYVGDIPPRPPTLNYYKYAFKSPTIQPPHCSNAVTATGAARVTPSHALNGILPGTTQHNFSPRFHESAASVTSRPYSRYQRDACPRPLAPPGSDLAGALQGASPAISREPGPMFSIPKTPAAAVPASTLRSSCAERDTAAPAQRYSLSNVPKHHFELGPLPLENGSRFIGEHSRSSSWQSCSTGVASSRRRESDSPSSAVTDIQEFSASAPEPPPVEPTPFISKLSHILELSEHREYIRWSRDGKSIILASHHPDLLKALSQYFKYTTITSLIRQLNIYSFKRLTTTQLLDILDLTRPTKLSASDYCGFAHPKFFRPTLGQRCSLGDFKPLSKQRSRKRRRSAGDEPNIGTMRHALLSRDQGSMEYCGVLGMHKV